LDDLIDSVAKLDSTKIELTAEIEQLKLKKNKSLLLQNGLPELNSGEELICHTAYCLVYDSVHKLAKWTAHILSKDIKYGKQTRSNDFRADPLIHYRTANAADYFTTITKEDGKIVYDGFGYDRGHLAPSADFKWSAQALSESYLYSNMSPQRPDFNRKHWADVEAFCRDYVVNSDHDVYIVTAPIIQDSMRVIERSPQKISIPDWHYKIMVDLEDKKGIAFLMPQDNADGLHEYYPIESYVCKIDSIESLTRINFFVKLSNEDENLIESKADISLWRYGTNKNDVAPIPRNKLPKNYYNTVEAKQFYDYPNDVTVCGKVVSATKSKKGHVFLNMDKSFPKQIFSVTIWKTNLVNFTYEPETFLMNKTICVKGRVKEYQGTASMYPENEKVISIKENDDD
jgi:endonuclease G